MVILFVSASKGRKVRQVYPTESEKLTHQEGKFCFFSCQDSVISPGCTTFVL